MPIAPSQAGHAAVYASCFQAAVEFGAPVAQRIAVKAGDALLKRAAATLNPQERQWQLEAERLLAQYREAFRAAYPGALRREFSAFDAEDSLRGKALSFDSLELMGEEQVDETVEVLRAQQLVLSEVESELGQLNSLICAAKGRDVVSAAANPFRPEAWVRALRNAAAQCPVPAWASARWLHPMSEALGPELASVYRQLCELLRKEGLTGASFVLSVAPAPRRPAAAANAGAVAAAPGGEGQASAPAAAAVLNLRDLRRLLAADRPAASSPQPPATGPGAAPPATAAQRWPGGEGETIGLTVPYAFEALQEMKQVDQVLHRMQQRRASGGDDAEALTPAQILGQEVVRLMVDNIATDSRLLPQIRQAVRQLEPALVRLARNDPRFFRDQQHPTRQFLTEITERSLAWSSAQQPGFVAFFEPLREAVAALATVRMDNAEPFEFALRSLAKGWSRDEERTQRERANAARALIKAERRNLLARRIGERLRQRPDVSAAPGDIRRFLTGPWAQVMAAAQMADPTGTADPGGYAAVVDDLLWTTRPGLSAEQRARLARISPSMMAGLRGGLASIEYPPEKTRHFLQQLADLHRLALDPEQDTGWDASGSGADAGAPDDGGFWLEPTEAQASGMMEFVPAPERQGAAGWQPTESAAAAPKRTPMLLEHLQPGCCWADLYLDGNWSRWKLAWASPQALLFMFSDGAGKYKSMTRSVLEMMMNVGALRFISEQTILSGALDAVAEAALRNSMESVR